MIKELEMVNNGAEIRFPNTEELLHKLNEVIAQVNANTQTINEFFKDAQPKAEPTKTYTEDEVAEMLGKNIGVIPCLVLKIPNREWCNTHCLFNGTHPNISKEEKRIFCWKHALQSGLLKGAEG